MITPQPNRVHDQNRQCFLVYLRTRYQDVLKKSLQGAALIALGLHTKPEAIAHPAHLTFRHLNQTEEPLPAGTSIIQVYDQAGGELLILGEPGAGKSTLLVHLAQGLLTRAEKNQEHLLPVIFNLSSWAQKRHSLSEWLVEELLKSYQVPRKVGKRWVENGQILPLLDGLDEVTASARDLCIDAINAYRHDHLVPLVVCSRTSEYFSQEHRLVLQSAVVVQPLTTEQIDDYLKMASPQLVALQTALQNNQVLRELAVSLLMLNVLTLTYRDALTDALPMCGSVEEQQCQVFASYIERMLGINELTQHTSSQRILPRLTWLARQMQRHSQTEFYLEQLQPNWLSGDRLMQTYERWAIRLPSVLTGSLVSLALYAYPLGIDFSGLILCLLFGGLLGGIFSRGSISYQPVEQEKQIHNPSWHPLLQWLGIGTFVGVCIGLSRQQTVGPSHGLSVGLGCGLYGILLRIFLKTNKLSNASPTVSQTFKGFSWYHLIRRTEIHNGILAILLGGLSFWLSYRMIFGLVAGLIFGLDIGLVVGLLSILLTGRSPEIQPADRIIWSWRNLRKSLFLKRHIGTALWSSILLWLSLGISYYRPEPNLRLSYALSHTLSLGLGYALGCWLLLGLFQGVSSETVDPQQRIVPNQGIRRSLSNGFTLGLASAIIVGSISFLSLSLSYKLGHTLSFSLSEWLSRGPVIGLSIGLLAGLFKGGWMYLQHYTLRFLLWREGSIPWKFPAFLDEAARHILLRKVGGGYVFIHRLFLDYIASLDGQ